MYYYCCAFSPRGAFMRGPGSLLWNPGCLEVLRPERISILQSPPERTPGGRSGPTTMLTEKQKHAVIDKVNEDIDMPLISEGLERRAIEKVLDKVVPETEPSLLAIIPPAYVQLIKIALKEGLTHEQRKEGMSKILREEISVPLASQLNERVDISFIPECIEGKVLKVVANKLVDEFVESAVDKDDGTEA